MCSILRPRSSRNTRSPFSVSSFAAQPPEIPDPTTIASYWGDCTPSSIAMNGNVSRISRAGFGMARYVVEPQLGSGMAYRSADVHRYVLQLFRDGPLPRHPEPQCQLACSAWRELDVDDLAW